MKTKLKIIASCVFSVLLYGIVNAQRYGYVGHVTLLKRITLNVGGGTTFPNSDAETVGVKNISNINLGIFNPICQKEKIGIGLHGFASYTFGKRETNTVAALPIAGYTSTVATDNTPKISGINIGVGPQLNIPIASKLLFSPIIDVAYIGQKIKGYTIKQTYNNGVNTNDVNLYSQSEIKTSGIGVIPRLRFQYWFTENIGLWLEGNYSVQSKIKTTNRTFVPSGILQGEYNIDQILTGTATENQVFATGGGVGVEAGFLFSINRKHYCLICGRRHRGKCKDGYTESTESVIFGLAGSSAKQYWNSDKQDCSATVGIECTDDITVSDDFDIENFDKYVATNDSQRIQDIFIKNDMPKFLPGLMQNQNAMAIIEGLKSGELTLKKIPNTNNKYIYQLGTPKNVSKATNTVKVSLSKRHDYVGHVTLLK